MVWMSSRYRSTVSCIDCTYRPGYALRMNALSAEPDVWFAAGPRIMLYQKPKKHVKGSVTGIPDTSTPDGPCNASWGRQDRSLDLPAIGSPVAWTPAAKLQVVKSLSSSLISCAVDPNTGRVL